MMSHNVEEKSFPFATMDLLPTVIDLLGLHSFENRPLDGASLVPYLKGQQTERPRANGLPSPYAAASCAAHPRGSSRQPTHTQSHLHRESSWTLSTHPR